MVAVFLLCFSLAASLLSGRVLGFVLVSEVVMVSISLLWVFMSSSLGFVFIFFLGVCLMCLVVLMVGSFSNYYSSNSLFI